MLQFGQITALGTVVYTAIMLLRNLLAYARLTLRTYPDPTRTDPNGAQRTKEQSLSAVVTQVVVWGTGILAIYVLDWVRLDGAFTLGGQSLLALSAGQKIVVGLMAASTLSTANDIKKAIDNTDSARTPPLIGNPIVPPKPSPCPCGADAPAAAVASAK